MADCEDPPSRPQLLALQRASTMSSTASTGCRRRWTAGRKRRKAPDAQEFALGSFALWRDRCFRRHDEPSMNGAGPLEAESGAHP
jgi:hypothetical protein